MIISLSSSGPPVISIAPSDQFAINNGSSAVFVCFALVFPMHDVYWTFTNASGYQESIISTTDMMNTSKYGINQQRNSSGTYFGALTVFDVRFSDRGTYSCNASNDIGSETNDADLTVHGECYCICLYIHNPSLSLSHV